MNSVFDVLNKALSGLCNLTTLTVLVGGIFIYIVLTKIAAILDNKEQYAIQML